MFSSAVGIRSTVADDSFVVHATRSTSWPRIFVSEHAPGFLAVSSGSVADTAGSDNGEYFVGSQWEDQCNDISRWDREEVRARRETRCVILSTLGKCPFSIEISPSSDPRRAAWYSDV